MHCFVPKNFHENSLLFFDDQITMEKTYIYDNTTDTWHTYFYEKLLDFLDALKFKNYIRD